jgi:hypothetical protein
MLKGKKTYLVAAVAVIAAVVGYLTGDLTVAAAAQAILTAVLGATLRNGMA